MILVDPRGGAMKPEDSLTKPGSPRWFVNSLTSLGIKAELSELPYGDFTFDGNGPEGPVAIGIERKTLHDMLSCIEDSRFASHQRLGMKQMYSITVLILEGHWKPHDPQGVLMEGFNGGLTWGFCRRGGYGRTMYSKLYRYLISLQLAGVIITYSRDPFHTSYNVHEWYHYFEKPWQGHTSLLEHQKVSPSALLFKPNLVRRWAHALTDVGPKLSDLAARQFRTPVRMANADETEWLRIPGVGVKTAQQIWREINGLNSR